MSERIVSTLLAIVFFAPLLPGQDAPSLGDAARRIRNEKSKAATPAAAPAGANSATRTAPPAPPVNTPAPVDTRAGNPKAETGPFAPYATRQEYDFHVIDRYTEDIRAQFEQEKFEALDQIAATARTTRARLPGGAWTIHAIYDPLMRPVEGTYDASESTWTTLLNRLQRWKLRRPNSITARVALAGAQLQYAWKARGGGYSDQVNEEGWQVFQERAELAAKTLVDAFALPEKCPEWYATMQLVARALGQSKEMQTAIFEKAIAFEPGYQYFYRNQAETLLPKWEGEEGEMAAFAARIADRIGGKKGDMIYYHIAVVLNCNCDSDHNLNGMSWPRIKRGYIQNEAQYGEFIPTVNSMAYMAGMAGDPEYAQELFTRIGEAWDEERWHTKENFQMVREWATASARGKDIEAALKAADDHLLTPDGRRFDEQVAKTFGANYGAAVADCVQSSGGSFMIPFSLLMQLAKNGAVEKVFAAPGTSIGACLSARVDKGMFPAPPEPDYWIKVSLQAQR